MRVALAAVCLLVVAGCGAHRSATAACTLRRTEGPVPETGEHTVAIRSSCAFRSLPSVRVLGQKGRRLPFALVAAGGPKGAHTLLLDKVRCDVRFRDLVRTVVVDGARLDVGRSLLDWCPAEAPSSVIHVYLGAVNRTPPGWRSVLRDAHGDRVWPCGPLRAAAARRRSLDGAAASACGRAIEGLPAGSPRAAFTEALGPPNRTGPRCTLWKWPPAGGAVDGVRACFSGGRATQVGVAVHG